jgi:hypothetical protein
MSRTVALLLLSIFALPAGVIRADYLIDPTGGTSLFPAGNVDDRVVQNIGLGFAFNFFGNPISTIDVSTNGNLNFIGDTEYENRVLPTYMSMIAPLWDDHYLYSGTDQTVTLKFANSILAVTWDVSQFDDQLPQFQFQVGLVSDAVTIGSFNFLKDDIVFSYNRVDPLFYDNEATVGLNWVSPNGTSPSRFVSLPGDPDGFIANTQAGLLSTALGDAILFRPNGSGSYDASLINVSPVPVPEPASIAMLAVATIGSLGIRRWKRK